MPNSNAYVPLTEDDIADALNLRRLNDDGDGLDDGNGIAREMLSGAVKMTAGELKRVAAYKNLTVTELIELDERFFAYEPLNVRVRKSIAANMLKKGFEDEFAAELCELPVDAVRKLIKNKIDHL